MSRSRDMRRLCKQLEDQGFEVVLAKSGHYKVIAPDGHKCQIAKSPRNYRAVLNSVTRLKRLGFDPGEGRT